MTRERKQPQRIGTPTPEIIWNEKCKGKESVYAQKLTGCHDIYAIIGGIHLFGASDRRVRLTLEEIKRLDVQRLGVSHCTGPIASAFLAHELGERFFFNHAGAITEVDV